MNHLFNLIFILVCSYTHLDAVDLPDTNLLESNPELNERITPEVQSEITEAITNVISRYVNCANFWDETFETFDDLKYAQFMALFAGDATVINDIGNKETILSFNDYAALVFKSLQIKGVPFKLENIEIKSIDIDDTGFYVAELAMDKIMYIGLDKKDRYYKIPKGKRLKIMMRVDMPDYLISDARIQSISNPSRKGLVQMWNDWYNEILGWPSSTKVLGNQSQKKSKSRNQKN